MKMTSERWMRYSAMLMLWIGGSHCSDGWMGVVFDVPKYNSGAHGWFLLAAGALATTLGATALARLCREAKAGAG